MRWVICKNGSESLDDIAINSDTIKNVHLLVGGGENFYCYNKIESDKHLPKHLNDESGDIVIETNDGKMYRFWEGGTEWDEFQDSTSFSIIIYQRLLQALGTAYDGSIIVSDLYDLLPVYRSGKVIVLFDYSEISKVEYNENGLGLFKIEDCIGHKLDGMIIDEEYHNEMLNGLETLKKEVQ